MKNIYLSYAREDAESAEELRRILLAQCFRPWRDPQPDLGARWHYEMEGAIHAADALILLVTASAAMSPYVTYEWALALGAGAPVFAIIYDEAPEHPRLSTVYRYDSRDFGDENHFWDPFLADFKRQLERAAAEKRPAPAGARQSLDIDKSLMPSEPGYWIVMRRGPLQNQMIQLQREVLNIGRDFANDIVIRDSQVSRFHLRLTLQGVDYHIEDLGSANGARVNGVQIARRGRLNDGDIIALGDAVLLTYDLVYPD